MWATQINRLEKGVECCSRPPPQRVLGGFTGFYLLAVQHMASHDDRRTSKNETNSCRQISSLLFSLNVTFVKQSPGNIKQPHEWFYAHYSFVCLMVPNVHAITALPWMSNICETKDLPQVQTLVLQWCCPFVLCWNLWPYICQHFSVWPRSTDCMWQVVVILSYVVKTYIFSCNL